jgi:heme ABC exporter ATP-binding subunit CcmA
MDPVIRFRSAVALVGRFPVLAGVDLDVTRAEIVLLQGANGAGKSSILRACAGLLRVVAGEAHVLGHDLVADPRPVRRRIGLLGHSTALYDDLSVVDNLRFVVRAAGGDVDRIEPALHRLGLVGRLPTTAVRALSAGQRRRCALAALVARDPELWLLDEPHAGLDAEHRDLLDTLVREAVARGATVVLASHEQDRAHALAGRIVTVSGGVTISTGPVPTGVPPVAAGASVPTGPVRSGVPPAAGGAVLSASGGPASLGGSPGAGGTTAAAPTGEGTFAADERVGRPFPPDGFPPDIRSGVTHVA